MDEKEYLIKIKEAFEKCMHILGNVQNKVPIENIKKKEFIAIYNTGLLIFIESMVGKEATLYYLIELAHFKSQIMWDENLMNQQQEDRAEKLIKNE